MIRFVALVSTLMGLIVLAPLAASAQPRPLPPTSDPVEIAFRKACQALPFQPPKIGQMMNGYVSCTSALYGKQIGSASPGALILVTLGLGDDVAFAATTVRKMAFHDEVSVNGQPSTIGGFNESRLVYGIMSWKRGGLILNLNVSVLCTGLSSTGADCLVMRDNQPVNLSLDGYKIARQRALELAEKFDRMMAPVATPSR